MALITCPDCSKSVSDVAPYCPHCGRPIAASADKTVPTDKGPQQIYEEEKARIEAQRKIKAENRGKGCLTVLLVFFGLVVLGKLAKDSEPTGSRYTPAPESRETTEALDRLKKLVRYKDLEILDHSWSISNFSIATWKVKLKNTSESTTFKDIHFATFYYAPSGTEVDRSILGHTAYITIKPGQTKTIEFTEFAHSQASKASIMVDSAKTD